MIAIDGWKSTSPKRLQLRGQLHQFAAALQRNRGTRTGDGNNLALQMMPAQKTEQIIQKTQRTYIARRADVEDRDVSLYGNCAERRWAVCGCGANNGAGFVGLVRVEHGDRNVVLHGGQQRCRMQHLRAEAGQLGGLMKTDLRDALSLGTYARIGGQNAADVRPNLDALGHQRRANDVPLSNPSRRDPAS